MAASELFREICTSGNKGYTRHLTYLRDDLRNAQKEKQAIAVKARLEVTAAPGIP